MSYQGQLSGPLGYRQTEARNAQKANEHMAWTQRQNDSTMYAKQQDQRYCKKLEELTNKYIRDYGNDEDIQKIKNMNPNNWSCQEILEELNLLLDRKEKDRNYNTNYGGKIRRHKKKSNRRTKKSRRRQRKQTRRR
jgi:hypothetical protein